MNYLWIAKKQFKTVICPCLKHVIGDGAYGNKTRCLIAHKVGLELISKLNHNTGLYLPYHIRYICDIECYYIHHSAVEKFYKDTI
ncbi:MAG: hypothetical protein AAF806_23680 [Bacteroidota bacterium]